MNKFSDDIENLEAKNLKYWSNFYAREGSFTPFLISQNSKFCELIGSCCCYELFQADKYQNVLRNFDFVKADLMSCETLDRRFNTLTSVLQKLETEEAIQDR